MATNKARTTAARSAARKEAKAKHQETTQAQADKDALAKPREAPEQAPRDPAKPLSLHELNKRAKAISTQTRDENRQVANAIAKSAYDSLQGRRSRGVHMRAAHVRDAEVAMANKQSAQQKTE